MKALALWLPLALMVAGLGCAPHSDNDLFVLNPTEPETYVGTQLPLSVQIQGEVDILPRSRPRPGARPVPLTPT